jgi:hypothetical protein
VAVAGVLPASSIPSKTAPKADSAPKATVKAKPKAAVDPGAPVSVGSVTYNFNTTTSSTSAATVLDSAATAISEQAGPGTEPNVDWSAPYCHMVQVTTFYGLGNQPLAEKQVDELPTDPNKLWPILEGFDNDSLTSDPASPGSNASTMFQSIWNMVTSEPLCQGGTSTTVYVSANLVSSVPKSVSSMIAYDKAHEQKEWVAPAPTPKL